MQVNARQSNFELLRIVAMMFIVAHHFLIATGNVDYRTGALRGGELLNSFCVVGVNCFILISGYFGIRPRWQKVAWLFYAIAGVAVADVLLGSTGVALFDRRYALHTIIPFVKGSNWFIPAYLGLMCLAPLLNKALGAASAREVRLWTALLTLLNVYAYFVSAGSVNPNGYTLCQFIYLYVLGFCVRTLRNPGRVVALGLYVAGVATAFLVSQGVRGGYTAFAYNSPQVLVASVGLFVFFSTLRMKSVFINRVSHAMFVVFLFHYVVLIWLRGCKSTAEAVLLYVSVFVVAVVLDSLLMFIYRWAVMLFEAVGRCIRR